MERSTWAQFIEEHARGDKNADIARKVGVDPSNITRWLKSGKSPEPQTAVDFANAYGVNPIAALVASGHIQADSIGLHLPAPASLNEISTSQLLDELQRRLTDLRESIDQLEQNSDTLALQSLVTALTTRHTQPANVGGTADTDSDHLTPEETANLMSHYDLAADERDHRDEEAEADTTA